MRAYLTGIFSPKEAILSFEDSVPFEKGDKMKRKSELTCIYHEINSEKKRSFGSKERIKEKQKKKKKKKKKGRLGFI